MQAGDGAARARGQHRPERAWTDLDTGWDEPFAGVYVPSGPEAAGEDGWDHTVDLYAAARFGDCACCGQAHFRTISGGCTYCDGSAQVCCRN